MPKLVKELAQGLAFSRSSDGGGDAYQATRKWRVILNSPSESWDIAAAVGLNIGSPYSTNNPIPCISLDVAADGESRMVRIVTAQFRSSPGVGTTDPKSQEPTTRPALYSMSTSLTEIAAWGGAVVTGGVSSGWTPAVNPVGDLVDGITRLEPVVTINIDQYSSSDMSSMLGYCGYVNSAPFTFSSMTIGTHCCMLQNISSTPVVEQFGDTEFRGFKVTFGFAVRAHWTITRDGFQAIGWDMAVPQTGFNIVNTQSAQSSQENLMYEMDDGKVKEPLTLVKPGQKVPAQVTIAAGGGSWTQRSASQPVALNDDGTPRSPYLTPAVLINRICIQPEMAFGDNFANFGIRWFS